MTDLEELQQDNMRRLQALAQKGTQVQNLGQLYLSTMLEVLLGDRLDEAKMLTELKVKDQLDNIEKMSARAHLLAPLQQANGAPPKLV